MVIDNLYDNVKINKSDDGYEISINRFDSNYEYEETEVISIPLKNIEILLQASEIIKNRYNDEEFIKNLENCFSPECIINEVSNTLGESYSLGIYSSEYLTQKINQWNPNYKFWVTSHETYEQKIDFVNWYVGDLSIKYDWANVVQYSDSGYCNGLEGKITDVDISTQEDIKSFISSDDILGYDENIGIINNDEYQRLR